MKDQPSTSKHDDEPPRGKSIPEDFIWDPKIQAWYAPGEPVNWDLEAEMREIEELHEEIRRLPPSARQNIKAPPGILDVPAAWRKSLGGGEPDLFSGLGEDDSSHPGGP